MSRQRLSKCRPEMAMATPWVGHSGRLNNRRRVRWRNFQPDKETIGEIPEAATSDLSHPVGVDATRLNYLLNFSNTEHLTRALL